MGNFISCIILILLSVCIVIILLCLIKKDKRKDFTNYYEEYSIDNHSPGKRPQGCVSGKKPASDHTLFETDTLYEQSSILLNKQDTEPGIVLDTVQFTAIHEKKAENGQEVQIDIFVYEDEYRYIIDEYMESALDGLTEKPGGYQEITRGSKITVSLFSRKISFEDELTLQWKGKYLDFSFMVLIPDDFADSRLSFTANVYTEGLLLSRLSFTVSVSKAKDQADVERHDIRSAFVSYASQDREQVAEIVFGMKKARPDLDIFFDVEFLSSGDFWDKVLKKEILDRDLLYLCWSRNARESEWVEREWRCAYESKGSEAIEPVPLEPPDLCPPPMELSHKHFNDILLYIIRQENDRKREDAEYNTKQYLIMNLKDGKTKPITREGVSIGRSLENDIVVSDDNHVSRLHCKLYCIDNNSIFINDSSTNGTIVMSQGRTKQLKNELMSIGNGTFEIVVGNAQFLLYAECSAASSRL